MKLLKKQQTPNMIQAPSNLIAAGEPQTLKFKAAFNILPPSGIDIRSTAVNTHYETLKKTLRANPKTWLITGVAGFIGSNLLEALLTCMHQVSSTPDHERHYEGVESPRG